MVNERRLINIFWTGGLDSTFRVIELSRCHCTIQPYYVVIRERKSFYQELNAIKTISQILGKDKRTKAEILDPIIVDENDILRDTIVFDSWLRIMKGLSWQYYVLAKFVKQNHLEMEMSFRFSPNGTVARVLEPFLIPHPDSNYKVLVLDRNRASEDVLAVFGNYCFPQSLYHKDKREEVNILKNDGYNKALKHVWFCFDPVWGYPCGHCFPCCSFEEEGVSLPRIGKLLYTVKNLFKKTVSDRVINLNFDYEIQEVSDVFLARAKNRKTGEIVKVFRLNETGLIILESLQSGADVNDVARRLVDGFDVDYKTAKSQASAFISRLNSL